MCWSGEGPRTLCFLSDINRARREGACLPPAAGSPAGGVPSPSLAPPTKGGLLPQPRPRGCPAPEAAPLPGGASAARGSTTVLRPLAFGGGCLSATVFSVEPVGGRVTGDVYSTQGWYQNVCTAGICPHFLGLCQNKLSIRNLY